ncbi:MAG: hypothetical protein M1420_03100 [Actinobacteria bacterium]|nr:hypothetical protein [Actinomycetota bacterium]
MTPYNKGPAYILLQLSTQVKYSVKVSRETWRKGVAMSSIPATIRTGIARFHVKHGVKA